MTDKQEYEIGDYIKTRCETCDVMRSQIVESVGAKKQITRVTCPRCGTDNITVIAAQIFGRGLPAAEEEIITIQSPTSEEEIITNQFPKELF